MSLRFVTFTTGHPYSTLIPQWRGAMRQFKQSYVIRKLESRKSWARNGNLKAQFIFDILNEFQCPVVWLDIDGELVRHPVLFRQLIRDEVDVAAHWLVRQSSRPELLSGTLFFNNTPVARELLTAWSDVSKMRPSAWDQRNLHEAMCDWDGEIYNLPPEYCAIDFMKVERPVIIHHQASRSFRRIIDEP